MQVICIEVNSVQVCGQEAQCIKKLVPIVSFL